MDAINASSARRTLSAWTSGPDLYGRLIDMIDAEGLLPMLDVGCADRYFLDRLAAVVPTGPGVAVGVDSDPRADAGIRADACALPFASHSIAAVSCFWMLYELDDPLVAIAEAYRVLRPRGVLAATTTRRDDAPELRPWLDPQPATSFDAEDAEQLVRKVFGRMTDTVAVEPWVQETSLETETAVCDYLIIRGASPSSASDIANAIAATHGPRSTGTNAPFETPFTVTRRGITLQARKGIG